jgi:hypothetical protein
MAKPFFRRTALLAALGGVIAIGLAVTAFEYYDQPSTSGETVAGTVTNTWRERGGFVYCQIRLADGVVLNDQCDNYPIGASVSVTKGRRALSGRVAYSVQGSK